MYTRRLCAEVNSIHCRRVESRCFSSFLQYEKQWIPPNSDYFLGHAMQAWDAITFKPMKEFVHHIGHLGDRACVLCCAFSPVAPIMVSGDDNTELVIWGNPKMAQDSELGGNQWLV